MPPPASSLRRDEVERAYADAFKATMRPLDVRLGPRERGRRTWSKGDALGAMATCSQLPLFRVALGRGTQHVMLPDLQLDARRAKRPCHDGPALRRAVLRGRALSWRVLGRLRRLEPLHERVALTLAYAIQQCWPRPRVIVPFYFHPPPLQTAHANMLLVELEGAERPERVTITVYEPNGAAAHVRYGAQRRELSTLVSALRRLLDVEVTLRGVGAGLQLLLGERLPGVRWRMRGYGVCQALCFWILRGYLLQSRHLTLQAYDASLARCARRVGPECRRGLQLKFMRYLCSMRRWVSRHYRDAAARQLDSLFAGSNVSWARMGPAQVRFGKDRARLLPAAPTSRWNCFRCATTAAAAAVEKG